MGKSICEQIFIDSGGSPHDETFSIVFVMNDSGAPWIQCIEQLSETNLTELRNLISEYIGD